MLIWAGVGSLLRVELDKTVQNSIQEGASLARLADENTTRLILGVDRTLMLLRQTYEDDPQHFDLRRWANRTNLVGDLAIHYATIDPDGYMGASTASYEGRVFLADREHFKVQQAATEDKLFISKPVLGRASGKWSIQLTRQLRKPDGSFGGVILGSLDPAFILGFYETVDLGARGSVTLRGLDGVVRGSHGFRESQIGRLSMPPILRDAIANANSGHFWGNGDIDSVRRLVSFRTLKNFPLIVTIGLAEDTIFASYEQHKKTYLGIAIVLTVLVLLVIRASIAHQRRLDRIRDDLHRSEGRARAKSLELELTLNNMSQGIMMVDPDLRVPVLNKKAIELLGLPASITDESIDYAAVKSSSAANTLLDSHHEKSPNYGDSDVVITETTRPDGRSVEVRDVPLPNGGRVCTYTDITDRKLAEKEILHLAKHDTLTNLANRSLLRERLNLAFDRHRRDGEKFAILFLDLDRFKPVNDTFGHPAGDILIQKVAERLRQCLPHVDTVARLGGDEFVVLQTGVQSLTEVVPLAERILAEISTPYEINGNTVVIGTSIGIVLSDEQHSDADDLLGCADLALYRAKAEGRNCYRFFESEMANAAVERGKLELELREALEKGQFELFYQPWIELASGKISGCEALIRWRHPRRGLVFPGEFVRVLEEIGLIGKVGEWILLEACREAKSWPEHVRLAVNLSPAQFTGIDLSDVVLKTLDRTGFDASRLELEITESLLFHDQQRALQALHKLRSNNVSIALDDFGTGYSSLTYLSQFPFDRIKIDKGFVADMTTRSDCAAIVGAVVNLGRSLGVSITAEGIETVEHATLLRAAGCTQGQGYLFSRPIPAAEVATMLHKDENLLAMPSPVEVAA